MRIFILPSVLLGCLLVSCHFGKAPATESLPEGRTPVTVTTVKTGALNECVELHATSQFQLKTSVKSSANGYLQEVSFQLGQKISKGDKLFVIKSKEAQNLGNTVSRVDSSLRFTGRIRVNAPGSGYILQLAYREGDYVQDGEIIATIGDLNSLVFLLELPYELRPFLPGNRTVTLSLPDGEQLKGTVTSAMPMVDAASQTQSYIIKVNNSKPIPENLIAKVQFVTKASSKAMLLPKEAILTNEVQSQFWIMQMKDSITAVKVLITKGIEAGDSVEIVSPHLNPDSKILVTGNYGLPDTAKVVIEK
ncbi:MAG: efflux RND transporter periplasmic adaptor subunit [Prolixibacteraceae bacterium]|jgi:multidrug efflux pump subunit AcrA (membrane-fusion protein)